MLPRKDATEIDLLKSSQTPDRRPRQAWEYSRIESYFRISSFRVSFLTEYPGKRVKARQFP